MGKRDALDRLVQILIVFPALFSLVNGGFMVWDPQGWYQLLPTVQATGAKTSISYATSDSLT